MLGVLCAFGFLTVYFTGLFPASANPNELSRFQTVVAMTEWKTFSIDRAIGILGDHEDKSTSGGRFYSNKAPGLAFAAYPVYRALRLILPLPGSGSSGGALLYGIRLLTVSLACVLALGLLARRIADEARSISVAPLVILAVGFGTPMLFYARSFFSHAWTASLLFFAWELLRRGEKPGARGSAWIAVLSGFLAALAAISEYTVAPISLLLAARACVGAPRRRALEFAAGAVPVLLLLLAYDTVCFGSPFVLSSAREAAPQYESLVRKGYFGFRRLSPAIALAQLIHPARGALVFSPFLAWSALGVARWWRSRQSRPDCVLVLAAAPLFLLILSMYPNWHGGGALGNRYLLPCLFFVAVPIGRALDSPLSRGLFVAATTFSVAQFFLLTSSFPHLPLSIPWPAVTASPWFLARGFIAANVGSLLGAGPVAALAAPAVATLIALGLAARSARPMRPGLPAALALGIVPLVAFVTWPPALPFEGRLMRASILHRFSDRDPEGRELTAVMSEAATAEERSYAEETWRRSLSAKAP